MQVNIRTAAVIALTVGGIVMATWAASAADSPWHDWKVLHLRAGSIPFFSGRVEMQLSTVSGKLRFETSSTARFFGARIANSRTSTVIDPATGRTESYISYSRKRGRRYTFGEHSYVVEKLLSAEESSRSAGRWAIHSRAEFDYPQDDNGKPVKVFDYYGMLLHLRQVDLHEIEDEVVLHVATSKGPQPYRIRVSEIRTSTHTLTDLRSGKKNSLPVRELRLRIIPADPEQAGEGFLEMEGETELWVEAETKTPLLLSGRAPKIPGRIRLELFKIG
jgi:hypothetical protein